MDVGDVDLVLRWGYATSIDDLSKLTGALEIIAHKHCGLGVICATTRSCTRT